jgi:hypothetical protein
MTTAVSIALTIAGALSYGLACAIIGVAYAVVLAREDNPANRWFRWINEWHDEGGWRSWIGGPLGGCAKCFSGQLALWSCSAFIPWAIEAHSLLFHALAAASAIIFAQTISHGYQWMRRQI